jgi:SAM-dependent methyltransferase
MTETFTRARLIYDVGAGVGHVAKALWAAGLSVVAIDLNRRARQEYAMLEDDGLTFGYLPGSIVMLCRPCHGPSAFTEGVVDRAVNCGASNVLYVGKPKNVTDDLGKFRRRFRVVLRNAGKEGESVYLWQIT